MQYFFFSYKHRYGYNRLLGIQLLRRYTPPLQESLELQVQCIDILSYTIILTFNSRQHYL